MATQVDEAPDWGALIRIVKFAPLSSICYRTRQVAGDLWATGPSQHLVTVPRRSEDLVEPPEGPFIIALLWATGEGAALRAMRGEIEKDEGEVALPPPELLPASSTGTYGDIRQKLAARESHVLESANYRIAKDGAFICRRIGFRLATYFFRRRENDDGEMPFAILWRMKGNWREQGER